MGDDVPLQCRSNFQVMMKCFSKKGKNACHYQRRAYNACINACIKPNLVDDDDVGFPPSFGACDPMPASDGGFPPSFGA